MELRGNDGVWAAGNYSITLKDKTIQGHWFRILKRENADDVADLIALLKEKDTESDKSVHFYFPSALDNGQQTSDHVVIDASGFAAKFAVFEKGCTSPK